ncbi:MAG: FAD-dependent oxidoreductase [Defluviimonas sp.]|uniref:FAD-dependent oxidoreductase n=1 Tax=Albidovulum sp. TaxID=1872424 RepID=UPI002A32DA38|nr:FAD-dependent oxidoreductase [Defluviimonas sp.]
MSGRDADLLVIGGGPAGVGAAIEARRRGLGRVVILEREETLGGATRHCAHSPFGMREFGRPYFGGAYGRRLAAAAAAAGVELRTGTTVTGLGTEGAVEIASEAGTGTLSAERVLLATGARESSRAARLLTGDRPVGILTTGALQAYHAFHGLLPFRRPVIVGSALVSHSALLTCLTSGVRPVAMVEPAAEPLARWPIPLFPRLARVPLLPGTEIVDIVGAGRVRAVRLGDRKGRTWMLDCDGVLLTGEFVPEAALLLTSGRRLAPGGTGPRIDQWGQLDAPWLFAAGNLLRPVETGGWAYREGRAVGAALAADRVSRTLQTAAVEVTFEAPVKLVVPNLIRPGAPPPGSGFGQFQLRFSRPVRGRLALFVDGRESWSQAGHWRPERRILVPMPAAIDRAGAIGFRFEEAT